MKKRRCFYYILILVVFSIIVGRLIYIKSKHSYYEEKLTEKTQIYVSGSSAPRGRILDTNGNVLVDNVGVKTLYYNKIKGISTTEEITIAQMLASILTIREASTSELKEYWLVLNNNGKDLITAEEYQRLNERKITNDELEVLKREFKPYRLTKKKNVTI